MFKRKTQSLDDVLSQMLREQGLETPLRQKRLIDEWDKVTGPTVTRYTGEKFIKNQTLHVKIVSPALRHDLTMMRTQLVKRLNEEIGAMVIAEVRIY